MRPLAHIAHWVVFTAGDLISKPMSSFDWAWLYPAYNRLMGLAVDINDRYDLGQWEDVA